ncbi:MAG: hypothetical protein KAI26_07420, partial [Nanoarchaeota archaeon]|nr:hypothetical protein [Nanoarchaeota archaeon]
TQEQVTEEAEEQVEEEAKQEVTEEETEITVEKPEEQIQQEAPKPNKDNNIVTNAEELLNDLQEDYNITNDTRTVEQIFSEMEQAIQKRKEQEKSQKVNAYDQTVRLDEDKEEKKENISFNDLLED